MSGGAIGADYVFGMLAEEKQHDLIHFTFSGHDCLQPKYAKILTDSELNVADAAARLAAKSIKRKYPSKSKFVNNLLLRNYYQVRWSDRVYAVAKIENDSSLLKISGGTAWACQYYVDKWYMSRKMMECELYLYDMNTNRWLQWIEEWREVLPPRPHGVYAGIGSRDITTEGVTAIYNLYN